MPPTDAIMQYGAFGVILLTFVFLVWKGVPAFKDWLDKLLDTHKAQVETLTATFKAEIGNERTLGEQRVKDEREAAAKISAQQMMVLDKHTEAVNAMRQKLEDLVQRSTRP